MGKLVGLKHGEEQRKWARADKEARSMLGWWTREGRLTWPQEAGKEESTNHL